MAVVLRRKSDGVSKRQQEALEAVGLAPAKEPVVQKDLEIGQRVRVTNSMFFWRKDYKPGDTGTVRKYWPAPDTPVTRRPLDDLYSVELDIERVVGSKRLTFCLWELEPIG